MAFNFNAYMKNIAETHKDIQHTSDQKRFYEVSGIGGMEDVLLHLRSMQGTIMLVETNHEGRIVDVKRNYYVDVPRFRFYILKRGSMSNQAENTELKTACKTLAFSILAKMRHDYTLAHKMEADASYRDIDLSSIRYDTIGPLATHWMGIMVELGAQSSASENGWEYKESDYS